MCNSKLKSSHTIGLAEVAKIDGRPVLQPASNRVAAIETNKPIKKSLQRSLSSPISVTYDKKVMTPPISPKLKPIKRGNDPYSPNSSVEKPVMPKPTVKLTPVVRKKPKSNGGPSLEQSLSFKGSYSYGSVSVDKAPGSIAAAQREQVSLMQAQRKMKIAHYGRTPKKLEKVAPTDTSNTTAGATQEEKRCSFITANSDPLYVAYHDEEWGVPVHDDRMLFELQVLSAAQVGLDWATILKKRNDFRSAFADFDAEVVAKFTEKQIASISSEYGLDLGRVRGVVDNSKRILEVTKQFGSLDKYLWSFVNHKPISTNYKSCRKIPVKTSKSETISKDMVRRGFRFVGPTVIHSFMQAAGLTNDHLVSCPRHLHCSLLI